ncbi:MAG: SUMF1/EgtB/PvdO family nonheme iron enzyme, partial [Rhodothermales bacterium]|nr:SUMF1/EgtB/PvdO family nonheme iron enzyme [Rhodothermales bacterium]
LKVSGGLVPGPYFLLVKTQGQASTTRTFVVAARSGGAVRLDVGPGGSVGSAPEVIVEVTRDGYVPRTRTVLWPAEQHLDLTLGVDDAGCQPAIRCSAPAPRTEYVAGADLLLVPAGEYVSSSGEVTLTQPYYIGETEVTRSVYEAIRPEDKGAGEGNTPMRAVYWEYAAQFADALSVVEGLETCYASSAAIQAEARELPYPYSCFGYRFPTEAEWEFAARAGSTERFAWGSDPAVAGDYAVYWGNTNNEIQPVGSKLPNAWGLWDVHGNVAEFVHDAFGVRPTGVNPVSSGVIKVAQYLGGHSGERVVRGGHLWSRESELSFAHRRGLRSKEIQVGFRPARTGPNLDEANRAPITPHSPSIPDGTAGVAPGASSFLSWRAHDPDFDPLQFSVFFGPGSAPELVANQREASYTTGPLLPGTEYFWRVEATDRRGGIASSPTWRFSTTSVEVDTSDYWTDLEGFSFQRIPPGSFTMGSVAGEPIEAPPHLVTITRPLAVSRFEMTRGQWWTLIGEPYSEAWINVPPTNDRWPARSTDRIRPVLRAANELSISRGLNPCYLQASLSESIRIPETPYSCEGYRLPTEAEWEYVARAGTGTPYSFGSDPDSLTHYAWYAGNSGGLRWPVRGNPLPVGSLRPNPWGLFDVHGNESEWVTHAIPYTSEAQTDPVGDGTQKRGGSLYETAWQTRTAFRGLPGNAQSGFRPVRTLGPGGLGPPEVRAARRPVDGTDTVWENAVLEWSAVDPNGGPLTFDLYLGTTPAPGLVAEGLDTAWYEVDGLSAGTRYYWRVNATSDAGITTEGPIWEFSRRPEALQVVGAEDNILQYAMVTVPFGSY